jgi:hypothetical protein
MEQGTNVEEWNIDQSKALSKKGLYAPLSVYSRDDDTNPSSKPRKLAASLKDGALVDFLVQVGKEHNRKSNSSVGKNNGCRPLSQTDINDRIRMRSLTLIGGGINTSISSELKKKKASFAIPQQITKMKRKQMSGNENTTSKVGMHTCARLAVVNTKWNEYMARFLQDKQVNLECANARALVNSLSLTLSRVELVGSFVVIMKCKSNPHLVSKEGYLIGETSNTWRLATLPKHAEKKMSYKSFCKVLTVPKGFGTELDVVITTSESGESFSVDVYPATENLSKGRTIYIRIT